jgi:hypothetical protein
VNVGEAHRVDRDVLPDPPAERPAAPPEPPPPSTRPTVPAH